MEKCDQISMGITVRAVQFKGRKRSKDLMLGLNETIDHLAIANSVCWYFNMLRSL